MYQVRWNKGKDFAIKVLYETDIYSEAVGYIEGARKFGGKHLEIYCKKVNND